MILKTLTPEQTNIWISNLNKLIDLRVAVRKYSNEQYDIREAQYNERYGFWGRIFHNDSSFDELYIGYDGYYRCFGSMFFNKISKVDPYPPKLLEYKKILRYTYTNTRGTVIKRLKQKWENYAELPFSIHEYDLDMYQNIVEWHQELKEILLEGKVYDETFDLDEDC